MGRGGKVNCRRNFKNGVRSKGKGSDDSDEDYEIEVDENASDDDSEDLGNSVDEFASEESYGSYVEEEEEEEEYRKVVRSRSRKGSRANGRIRDKTSRKRKRVSYEEEEDEDYVNDDDEEEEMEDDEDEEFTPDEDDDYLDEDEELAILKKRNSMKVGRRSMQKRGHRKGQKKSRKSRVSKKPLEKKGRSKRRLKKKERKEDDDEYKGDFIDDSAFVREKSKKNSGAGRRKYAVYSDSDLVSSGSSDCEFTISEEERELVREANMLLEAKTSLRSSSSIKKIQEDVDLCQQGKPLVKKGKEKVKEVKSEMGKQVCGICLSEEDKRRSRGTLNCCNHYFCFTCIHEWSKVESRCPLCKQRFKTITKNGRADVGFDPRNVVVEVPKRDQVYQPSEEEIRSFIDPYENVICTECREGGDDGLMLLCDLCDSSAHTYCVGLGRQVPEGNWYCDACRPVVLGSSSSQSQDPLPDQRTIGNGFNKSLLVENSGEGLDSTLEPSPRLAVIQGFGNLQSPRFPTRDVQAASTVSGTGAPTLSVRRQIQRHIQNLISINRMSNMAGRFEGMSASSSRYDLSNPQMDQCRENGVQNSSLGLSHKTSIDERLQANDHPSCSVQYNDPFSLRTSQLRMQAIQDPTITTTERSINLTLWPELTGINSIAGCEQLHQCNRPSTASQVNLSSHIGREESQFYVIKEQLQSMVKSHLKSLSQDIELGNDTVKDIARSSIHTILAACGLEHKRSEVHSIPPPSICTHSDRMIAGQISMMKGFCSLCFDSFARDIVKRIMDSRFPRQRLSLDLNL